MSTNGFIDEIVDRLSGIEPSVQFIASNTINVLDATLDILMKNYDVKTHVDQINRKMDRLQAESLQNMELNASVMDPFGTAPNTSFTLQCKVCESLSDSSKGMKDKFNDVISVALNAAVKAIDKFDAIEKAKKEIQSHAQPLFKALNSVINIVEQQQKGVADF